ncbi:MAG: 50S ribosomal protein L20 [Nitrospirota bacterium]
MPRVKGGPKRRRRSKKILKLAKGYWGAKSRLFKSAKETVEKGLCYAYRDRKRRKREFRTLWIIRINAALSSHGLSYSRFISSLKNMGIELNRKVLADMAINDPDGFTRLTDMVKESQGTCRVG